MHVLSPRHRMFELSATRRFLVDVNLLICLFALTLTIRDAGSVPPGKCVCSAALCLRCSK